jgi:predicted permease
MVSRMIEWFGEMGRRVRMLMRWDKFDREMEEEIRLHREMRERELGEAGESPEEAYYGAQRKVGNTLRLREESREAWGWNWLEHFLQDVRYGLRMLRKSPGFTAVAVLTLALGIGANTAIFSLINAVMLRSLPVPNPQQLVVFGWTARQQPTHKGEMVWGNCQGMPVGRNGIGNCSFSLPLFQQLSAQQGVFSGMAAFFDVGPVAIIDGHATPTQAEFVSGNYFSTLGVQPFLGRMIDPLDDATGALPVAVLGYKFWQSKFAGDPSVVGKTIPLNRIVFTIVGVAPPGFFGLDPGIPLDLLIPFSTQGAVTPDFKRTEPASLWLEIVGRLKPSVSVAQAKAAMNAIFVPSVTGSANPMFKPADEPRIELPGASHGLGSLEGSFSKPLFLLMIAVSIILLIACANVAGLMLARATGRQKEMAVRFTLGASRWRIVRQALTESVMLALAGGALGVLFAYWGASSLGASFSANYYMPLDIEVHPDPRILGFTFAVSLIAGALFGLAPAFRGSRVNITPALKESGTPSGAWHARGRWFNLGNVLVVAQVALSMVVLAGAALLVRTLANLETMNPGFDTHNVLLFGIDTTLTDYKGGQLANLYSDLRNRVAALPGVTSASYSMAPLLSSAYMTWDYSRPGATQLEPEGTATLPVGPSFFETMRLLLVAGRTYTPQDFTSTAKPRPIIVNETFARKYFGKENPLGQPLADSGSKVANYEIVGVVADAKYYGLRDAITPTVYIPLKVGSAWFELRTAANPKALIPAVRNVVSEIDSNIPVLDVKTQTEQIGQNLFQERLVATLSTLFALLALLLACIGLYGLLSYEVTRRRHEIGLRKALGAQPRDILRLVVGQGVTLALIGAVVGIGTAFGVTRFLQSLLYEVKPADPFTFAGVAILLVLVALAACYIPARRAMRVDPMIALKYE